MMSVGLHCRLSRPARVAALSEFLDYAKSYGRDVWICTREEIADFWRENHYPVGAGSLVETSFQSSSSPRKTTEDKSKNGEMVDVKL